jgi:hypothetical protein
VDVCCAGTAGAIAQEPAPSTARNVHPDVALPNAGVDVIGRIARQSSGNFLGLALFNSVLGTDAVG